MVGLAFGDLGLGATESIPVRKVPAVPAGFTKFPQTNFFYNPKTLEKCLPHPNGGLVVMKLNEKFKPEGSNWLVVKMTTAEFSKFKGIMQQIGTWKQEQEKLAASASFWGKVPSLPSFSAQTPLVAKSKRVYKPQAPTAVGLPFKTVTKTPAGFTKFPQTTFSYNPKTLEKCLTHPATGKLVVIKMNEKFWKGKDGKWTVAKMAQAEFDYFKGILADIKKWGVEQEKLAKSRAFWEAAAAVVEPLVRLSEATKKQAIALIGKLFPQVSSQVAKRDEEAKKAYAAIKAMSNGPAKTKSLADWQENERRWAGQGAQLWAKAQTTMNDPEAGKKLLPPLDTQKRAAPAPKASGSVTKKVLTKAAPKPVAKKLIATRSSIQKKVPAKKQLLLKATVKKAGTSLRGFESAEFGNEFGIVPVIAVVAVIGVGAIALIKVLYEVSKLSSAAMLAANSLRVNAETNRATAIATGHVIQFADGRVAALTPTGQVVPVSQIEAVLPPPPKEGMVTGNSIRLPDGRIVVPELVTSATGVSSVTNVPTVPVSPANDPIEQEIQQTVGRTVPSITYPSPSGSAGNLSPIPVGSDVSLPSAGEDGEPLQSGFGGGGMIGALVVAAGIGAVMYFKSKDKGGKKDQAETDYADSEYPEYEEAV